MTTAAVFCNAMSLVSSFGFLPPPQPMAMQQRQSASLPSSALYLGFLGRPEQQKETDKDAKQPESQPEFLFPAIRDAVKEHAQDASTLQELQALEDSLQRLTAAKEGFLALMMANQPVPGTGTIVSAKSTATTTSENNDGVCLDELERIVAQLEEEASNSRPVMTSSSTKDTGHKSLQDYQDMIATLEAQVEQIASDHEAQFLQALQASQQASNNTNDFSLRSLEEINRLAQLKAANASSTSLRLQSSNATTMTDLLPLWQDDDISQEMSNFTRDVASSFASWKDQLNTVLDDVKQDGRALQLDTISVNNNSESIPPETQQTLSILARFRKAWRTQVGRARSQVQEFQRYELQALETSDGDGDGDDDGNNNGDNDNDGNSGNAIQCPS